MFVDYDKKSIDEKELVLKLATVAANTESFYQVAKILKNENEQKLKVIALKALIASAQFGWEDKMFVQINELYKTSNKAIKRLLVRLAPLSSTNEAVEMCKDAFNLGWRTESIKALAEFKNANSLETLKQIQKQTKNASEIKLLKKAIADVSAKQTKKSR